MLEALLFDVDGTIAETEDLHRRAFNLAFRELGVELRWEPAEYRRLLAVHGGKERIARSLAEHALCHGPEEVELIHATKSLVYEALLAAEGAPWRPGVRRLMREARLRGLKVAIVTTTSPSNLDPLFVPVMGRHWRNAFDAVVAGDAVGRKKPAPDAYVEALRRMRLRGERAVAFEDSAAGIAAARAAGCAVIATRSLWHPHADLGEADVQLEHLGDPGALWERPHPLIGQRWLGVKALAAWHEKRQACIAA